MVWARKTRGYPYQAQKVSSWNDLFLGLESFISRSIKERLGPKSFLILGPESSISQNLRKIIFERKEKKFRKKYGPESELGNPIYHY